MILKFDEFLFNQPLAQQIGKHFAIKIQTFPFGRFEARTLDVR